VSRLRWKGRNGREGWEDSTCMKLPFDCMQETYSGMDLESIKVSLIAVKQAWI
jgi:hypothetical protein